MLKVKGLQLQIGDQSCIIKDFVFRFEMLVTILGPRIRVSMVEISLFLEIGIFSKFGGFDKV